MQKQLAWLSMKNEADMKSNFWEFDGLVRTLQMEGTTLVAAYLVSQLFLTLPDAYDPPRFRRKTTVGRGIQTNWPPGGIFRILTCSICWAWKQTQETAEAQRKVDAVSGDISRRVTIYRAKAKLTQSRRMQEVLGWTLDHEWRRSCENQRVHERIA